MCLQRSKHSKNVSVEENSLLYFVYLRKIYRVGVYIYIAIEQ